MAALTPGAQEIMDPFRSGLFLVVTRVRVSGGADTVALPEGLISANHVRIICLDPNDTAATVGSITQLEHPQGATLNISAGGSANSTQFIVSMHSGNQAGL